jgi:hypothetical protein
MATAPFVQHAGMTAVALATKQANLIADQVLPRVPVSAEKFSCNVYPTGDGFTVPETKVGRKGKPNEVEFSSSELTFSTEDHALDTPVPNKDVAAWQAEQQMGNSALVDPRLRATGMLTQCLDTRREKRTAETVFNAANYTNKVVLSGTSQWSDYTNSDPDYAINQMLDSLVMRPNVPVFSRRVWSVLRRHPKLCAAYYKNGANAGVLTLEQFKEHFELPNVPLIGEGWLNTNPKGQAANLVRIWTNDAAFIYRDMNADTDFGITWGLTAQWGGRVAGTIVDPDMGMRGGERVRVGEAVKEIVVASDMGYLFKSAINE